jgi:hypothetical protein
MLSRVQKLQAPPSAVGDGSALMLQSLRLWRCADEGELLELRQGHSGSCRQQQYLHPHLREMREGGRKVINRFLNTKFALVAVLAFYAALGALIALEVTK